MSFVDSPTTYNEDATLLRQTLRHALAMRYPHKTYVLDDGRRPAVQALARELGCGYVTRDTNLHAKAGNWNNAFAVRLAPMDFASFCSQRLRWAEGNLKILRFINPITCRGLTASQRICYLASMFHWTIGVPKLIFYVAPPWMLFTRTFPIANFDGTFLIVYVVFLATLILTYRIVSRGSGRTGGAWTLE